MNRKFPTLLLIIGLFVLALVPRAVGTGAIVTVDEAYHWFDRVEQFWQAVSHGEYARTNIIGHPGVTTMWLGSLGQIAYLHLANLGWVEAVGDESPLYRTFLRFPLACVSSLSIAIAYLLIRRLAGMRVALLAALFWATDPFLVAHGQILHLDALLSAFVTLSLLTALLAFRFDSPLPPSAASRSHVPHWGWLLTSGMIGGFALLTKSPALILIPLIALIAGIRLLSQGHGAPGAPAAKPIYGHRMMRELVLPLGGWGAVAAMVWVGVWPAAWVDLPRAIARVVMQVTHEGADPHGWGNFFLGRAVDDPGPLFYPVVLALRLTPWTMLGLLAGGGIAWFSLVSPFRKRPDKPDHRIPSPYPWLGILTCFALLFLFSMSILPKKFDRYLLPIFPTLQILAAFGMVQMRTMIRHKEGMKYPAWLITPITIAKHRIHRGVFLITMLIMLLVGNLLWYHPYALAYYNPLLGGGARAMQTIPVGWGEGYEQVGAFISSQYNGCERATATWFAPVLARSLCNHWVVSLDQVFEPGTLDYAVLYIDQVQRNNKPEAIAWLRQHYSPLHTVRIHGIDYASIYQIPLPTAHPASVLFGSAMELTGYELTQPNDATMNLLVQWKPHEPINRDYLFFVHVIDGAGKRIAQIDVPPGGPRAPTSSWLLNSFITWNHPIPLPPDLAPGTYWVGIGVYDPDSFARLPVHTQRQQQGAPDDGPNVLLLDSFVRE